MWDLIVWVTDHCLSFYFEYVRFMSRKSCHSVFTARAFRKLLSIYVFSYFPFGFEGRMWDLIVSGPDHCLSFYFIYLKYVRPFT